MMWNKVNSIEDLPKKQGYYLITIASRTYDSVKGRMIEDERNTRFAEIFKSRGIVRLAYWDDAGQGDYVDSIRHEYQDAFYEELMYTDEIIAWAEVPEPCRD